MDTVFEPSLDLFPVGCVVTNLQRKILYSNSYFDRQYGYDEERVAGVDLFSILSKASQIIYDSYLMPLLVHEGQCDEIRLGIVAPNGKAMPVIVSARLEAPEGQKIFWSISNASRSEEMYKELAAAKELLQQKVSLLHSLADTDELTGLLNRAALTRHLNQQMGSSRSSENAFALAFLDLDGFKEINDAYGHDVGDKLLRLVAKRMAANLRTHDIVSRFGGDEFVVIMQGNLGDSSAMDSLDRLIHQLSQPFHIGSLSLSISASAGITLYPQTEPIASDQLIRQADQAMYQAKLTGRNRVCMFNLDKELAQKGQHQKATEIQAAIAEHQFELYFQPKVNMRTGQVLGAEALIRWNHPTQGLLGPASFLSDVSESHQGVELGRWVIAAALAQMGSWHDQGRNINVSVNIAGYHLQHSSFVEELALMLAKFPMLRKQQLELEVLETNAINDIDQVSIVLAACKNLGVNISLDDFGTGYSTLGHLKVLTVDVLKIDRSFVKDMLSSQGDLAILKGVISFAQAFECDVIAEGVETLQHGQRLIELGCEMGQGYYIARPMPAVDLPAWTDAWQQSQYENKFKFTARAAGNKG